MLISLILFILVVIATGIFLFTMVPIDGFDPEYYYGIFKFSWILILFLYIIASWLGVETTFNKGYSLAVFLLFIIVNVLFILWAYYLYVKENRTLASIISILAFLLLVFQMYITVVCVKNPLAGGLLIPVLLWVLFLSMV